MGSESKCVRKIVTRIKEFTFGFISITCRARFRCDGILSPNTGVHKATEFLRLKITVATTGFMVDSHKVKRIQNRIFTMTFTVTHVNDV